MKDNCHRLPEKTEARARSNVKGGYRKMLKKGINPAKTFVAVDTGASHKFRQAVPHMMPCLTSTRCKQFGWWISTVGRQVNLNELFRFQGIDPDTVGDWKGAGVTPKQMAHMIGNSITLAISERTIGEALWASGLVARKPHDLWATATQPGLPPTKDA